MINKSLEIKTKSLACPNCGANYNSTMPSVSYSPIYKIGICEEQSLTTYLCLKCKTTFIM